MKLYSFRADPGLVQAIEYLAPNRTWPALIRDLLMDECFRKGASLEFFDPDEDNCGREQGRPRVASRFTPPKEIS